MKKFYKIMAVAFAMALVVASPTATITSHAYGFNIDSPEDTTDRGTKPSGGESNSSSSNSDSTNTGSSNSGSSSSESSSSGSYDSGSSGYGFNADSPEDTTDRGTRPSSSGSSYQQTANDVIVGTTGGQKFRNVMNADHTSLQVYHCGISKVTFKVADAKGNVVAFKTVKLEQGEDNLWYENIIFADGVDTKGLTVTAAGDATYLKTELGVSGIKINGTLALSTVPATEEK